jgi:hypothetical protein
VVGERLKNGTILKEAIAAGIHKGWSGFVWMMKILVPISFLTAVIEWSGFIRHLDHLLQPVMELLCLPPMAALPMLIGALSGIYGAIAAMVVLPFTLDQMTLMAVFVLICHNVIQESVVQGKSGINPVKAILFRVIPAIVAMLVTAQFLDTPTGDFRSVEALVIPGEAFPEMVYHWAMTMLLLSVKIFLIMMSLLTIMEILKALGWIERIVRSFGPLFKVFGLNAEAGIIWITALIFGLAYGAAVIVEEVKKGNLTPEELERLHLSIGINHAIIEDPSLFLALGPGAFWLWVPRLIMAIVAVHLLTLWQAIRARLLKRG